jgi:hypothetical protein
LASRGVREFLCGLRGVVVPWDVATQTSWDLALAAHAGQLEQIHAPIAWMPHGTEPSKYQVRWDMHGAEAVREPGGVDRSRFVYHGRVVAAIHLVPTRWQADRLRRSVPEAMPGIVVVGDPCYDRLAASMKNRSVYRDRLGTGGRMLVTATSTWSPAALLGKHPGLLAELMAQLPPDEFQVAAIVHPAVWNWHGHRQIIAWYADCIRRGMLLIPPEEGWRATIAASDAAIGDYGSVTCYTASVGVPVVLGTYPAAEVEPGSAAARLAEIAPRLDHGKPYAPQILEAGPSGLTITDLPGRAVRAIRECLYAIMGLEEPAWEPRTEPVPAPRPVRLPQTFGGE